MRLLRTLFVLVLSLVAAPSLAAQAVRGVVVDEDGSRPVEGMVVALYGGAADAVAGGLTVSSGRFSLVAPGPGRYTLRAERVGYRTVQLEVNLAAGETAEVRLQTAVEAFVLAPVQVETAARCVVRPGVGLQAYELWEQAAMALRATALAQEQALVEYTVRTYTSEMTGIRRHRRSDPPQRVIGNPFQTLAPAVLARDGYMREDGSSFTFFGPDAKVLLSESFLDTHCLYVQTEGGPRGHVGVGFEPVDGRETVDIRGTLWLDARSGELRFVEYEYTGVGVGSRRSGAGGRIEFQRQRSGAWVVSSWYIRTARVQQEWRAGETTAGIVAEILEAGGEVTDVRVPGEDAGR